MFKIIDNVVLNQYKILSIFDLIRDFYGYLVNGTLIHNTKMSIKLVFVEAFLF